MKKETGLQYPGCSVWFERRFVHVDTPETTDATIFDKMMEAMAGPFYGKIVPMLRSCMHLASRHVNTFEKKYRHSIGTSVVELTITLDYTAANTYKEEEKLVDLLDAAAQKALRQYQHASDNTRVPVTI